MKIIGQYFIILYGLIATHASGTEIVYTPINPTFGGNPLNGSLLFTKAQTQNTHSEDVEPVDPLDSLSSSFDRLTISNVSRLASQIASGQKPFEEYEAELSTSNDNAIIKITQEDGCGCIIIAFFREGSDTSNLDQAYSTVQIEIQDAVAPAARSSLAGSPKSHSHSLGVFDALTASGRLGASPDLGHASDLESNGY